MDSRERLFTTASALAFLAAAVAIAILVPDERQVNLLVTAGLLIAYAVVLHVRFEFGGYYGSPEQLIFVPLLLLGPLPYLPLLVGVAGVLSMLPDVARSTWHRERWLGAFADSWLSVGGVIVLGVLYPGELSLSHFPIYLLALAAHFGTDLLWTVARNRMLDHLPLREVIGGFSGTARVDLILTPVGFVIALPAADEPLCLLAIPPLVLLFHLFSHDRRERYSKTLELNRAYRGVVMLLSDVVEFDDDYTAQHSRSVVDLVNSVADELALQNVDRQELEFAAMLHDVGKIAIEKDILNKPAALTANEFEVMKTHTIEGQSMLDRVGGLLGRVGEVVRSCHERWDGKGYPDGLAGEQIPLPSRIVFVCDAYHAMTSDRTYRTAMPRSAAFAELEANSGTQFDPRVVRALIAVLKRGEPLAITTDQLRSVLAGTQLRREVGAGVS
ncbi:MAG TPA: HD-GYP domain-containing protein, partial [Thermoleophilaceae bacterium]|nr:HD-GYP domain-containing protein [Thermoleophilaceae bacterium]